MKIVPETFFDKLVVNSLPGVFYVIDRSGRFIQWNGNLEKVTGYPAAEISRMSPLDFFSGDDKELIGRKISEVFETGYSRVEAGLVKKNGKKIPYIFSGKLITAGDQEYLIGEGLDITDLKSAKDLLAESERRLHTMLLNITDAIMQVDDKCLILEINRAGLAIYEAKNREQVIGKSVMSFVAPAFKKEVNAFCKNDHHGKEIVEYEIVGLSGARRWLETRTTPFEQSSRGVLTKIMITRDITERKHQTIELAEANSFLRNIFTTSPTGILAYNSDGRCVSASDSAGAMVGASKEQLLAQNFRRIKSWKRSGLLEAAEDTLATGRINRKATLITTTFGKEIWMDYQFARFYSADEPYLLLMFVDVRELKETEEALSESEAKYRQLMERANDAIFIADAETGVLIDANKKATKLVGKPLEKIIGMHQSKLHPEDERESIARVFKEQVSKGSGIVRDFSAINSSGERIPVEISASVMEEEGKIVIQGIFRDVTERLQSEKAIFEKDREIRRAYVDVLSAVTGGRLMIMDNDEISEALGRPISKSHTITSYKTLATARKKLSDTFEEYKSANNGYKEFVFAANEALANAVKHGTNGRYQVLKRDSTLQVLITDDGPGIDFSILPKATLVAGFSTKQSLGMGFSIMLDVCDKVLLSTGPGRTSVVLEKAIN